MRITSRLTYVVPFFVLLAVTILLTMYYSMAFFYYYYYNSSLALEIIVAIGLTAAIYLAAKKLALKYEQKQLKIAFLLFPLIIYILLSLVIRHRLSFDLPTIIFCGGFYLSFTLFSRRYTATLTENSIQYTSLLGLSGEIPLTAIVKLEEKKNILLFVLPYVIRYFRLLRTAKKTSITFCDENLDEYEIDILTNFMESKKIFNKIIEQANQGGNLKIRQYAF